MIFTQPAVTAVQVHPRNRRVTPIYQWIIVYSLHICLYGLFIYSMIFPFISIEKHEILLYSHHEYIDYMLIGGLEHFLFSILYMG